MDPSARPNHADEPAIPPALGDALRRVYVARAPDASELDRGVLGGEHAPRTLPLRRIVPWAGLAAAAGLALTFSLVQFAGPRPAPRSGSGLGATLRADLDGSGRVDILDAFLVARSIDGNARAAAAADPAWDVTGDGLVDRRDVDSIAAEAVSLGGAS